MYQKWLKEARKRVEESSKATLGYLHIRGMDWPSFDQFEADLYAVGAGKDGLIIDVRENGGGFTADHLLTILGQPAHAITVPRGGGAGYPQDRIIYSTWSKPIVVLCNQNSFSNAEIFAHAVKALKRGKLVGVPTAGGVISTGSSTVMDVGTIRTPGRGWFGIESGTDMELNGAVPDVVVWLEPGDQPKMKDAQLDAAVDTLMKDVAAWKARPRPELKKASERK
jgi:tricorn protease